jgi:hypothetical protein
MIVGTSCGLDEPVFPLLRAKALFERCWTAGKPVLPEVKTCGAVGAKLGLRSKTEPIIAELRSDITSRLRTDCVGRRVQRRAQRSSSAFATSATCQCYIIHVRLVFGHVIQPMFHVPVKRLRFNHINQLIRDANVTGYKWIDGS